MFLGGKSFIVFFSRHIIHSEFSCCVDSHTAAYIGAEAVIHFGSACLSEHDKLPVLYIFEKSNFEAKPFLFGFSLAFENENNFLIASDLKYHQPTSMLL